MRLSLKTFAPVAALFVVLVNTYAHEAGRPAGQDGKDAARSAPPNRRLRDSGMTARMRRRDPNAPPWRPGPIPETIRIRVSGVARDEAGKTVGGATVILYTITDTGSKPAGRATTDSEGRYDLGEATLPVMTSFGGRPFRPEITPYASFILAGMAPRLGIAWSPQQAIYALKEPHPDDIQGRLPLDSPVALDLTFPKAAALEGRVVDEDGRPVGGVKLQVMDADLLDEAGHETNNRQGYDWAALSGSVGRAVTGTDGGFRIEGIADRACFRIHVNRPETDNATLAFHAATIGGRDTVHEQLPTGAFNGRVRHEVKTNPITILFPKIRPIDVTVVGEDTGKPIAGARVRTIGEPGDAGITSYGTTDAAGKVLLGSPPGLRQGIVSDPPIATRYIRTEQRPLVVERREGAQPYQIRQRAGVELIIQAVGTRPDSPVAGAFFWKAPEDQPGATQHIETSTYRSGEPWTDANGELRAVMAPEPGRRYRFRFAGVHEPNMPRGINPAMANKQDYEAFPSQSAPIELAPGQTIRLRFVIRKHD